MSEMRCGGGHSRPTLRPELLRAENRPVADLVAARLVACHDCFQRHLRWATGSAANAIEVVRHARNAAGELAAVNAPKLVIGEAYVRLERLVTAPLAELEAVWEQLPPAARAAALRDAVKLIAADTASYGQSGQPVRDAVALAAEPQPEDRPVDDPGFDLIDVTGLSFDQVMALQSGVLQGSLARILEELDSSEEAVAGWQSAL